MPLVAGGGGAKAAARRPKTIANAVEKIAANDSRAAADLHSAVPPVPASLDAEKPVGLSGDTPLVLPQRHHHSAMLESMDRKARELCDSTRRQYELLLARAEAQHERQLQALQHKLQEIVATSLPLSEHRQVVSDLARTHERETRALVQTHDEEAAALRVRYKQIANEQLLRRGRGFQNEKDELLETMTQLEMDRNAALRQWREEELRVLSVQKELEEERQAHALARQKLHEACQHIVALKAQLPKIDRKAKKIKDERATHAESLALVQQQLAGARDNANELAKRVAVLETEVEHARALCTTTQSELVGVKSALAARETQATELQRALAESAAKETLLREFRDSERDAHEQQRLAWRDAQVRLESHEADARRQVAALQQEKQASEAQHARFAQEAARIAMDRDKRESALREKLRSARLKRAAAAQRVAQLEAVCAEQQDEERVQHLLFGAR